MSKVSELICGSWSISKTVA